MSVAQPKPLRRRSIITISRSYPKQAFAGPPGMHGTAGRIHLRSDVRRPGHRLQQSRPAGRGPRGPSARGPLLPPSGQCDRGSAVAQALADIPLLTDHFIALFNRRMMRPAAIVGIAPQAPDSMNRYNWPGNVRELSNAIGQPSLLEPRIQFALPTCRRRSRQQQASRRLHKPLRRLIQLRQFD